MSAVFITLAGLESGPAWPRYFLISSQAHGEEVEECRLREIATLVDAVRLPPSVDPARFGLNKLPDARI
jgi:hypothetical protein